MISDLAILYLHRYATDARALRMFVDAYRTNPAGIRHDLIVLAKGFEGRLRPQEEGILAGLSTTTLFLEDEGFDIGSYRTASHELPHRRVCFLNSHARPLVSGWLRFLCAGLDIDGVGVSGASGSWMSSSSSHAWRVQRLTQLPRRVAGKTRSGIWYPRFPNPHLRTNAFTIDRELFLSLDVGELRRKADAYQFESGRRSMTRQLNHRGLRSVVMDRFGRAWEVDEWRLSGTFWAGEQSSLLVGDNQTRKYADATEGMRHRLRAAAWAGGVAPSDAEIALDLC